MTAFYNLLELTFSNNLTTNQPKYYLKKLPSLDELILFNMFTCH